MLPRRICPSTGTSAKSPSCPIFSRLQCLTSDLRDSQTVYGKVGNRMAAKLSKRYICVTCMETETFRYLCRACFSRLVGWVGRTRAWGIQKYHHRQNAECSSSAFSSGKSVNALKEDLGLLRAAAFLQRTFTSTASLYCRKFKSV